MPDRLDLENLILTFHDGCIYSRVFDQELFDNQIYTIVEYNNRNSFNRFCDFINGSCPSHLEDDYSIFDLKPFLIDIGYSDMTITFKLD